jgi:uncharacterized UPF0146 family protein
MSLGEKSRSLPSANDAKAGEQRVFQRNSHNTYVWSAIRNLTLLQHRTLDLQMRYYVAVRAVTDDYCNPRSRMRRGLMIIYHLQPIIEDGIMNAQLITISYV